MDKAMEGREPVAEGVLLCAPEAQGTSRACRSGDSRLGRGQATLCAIGLAASVLLALAAPAEAAGSFKSVSAGYFHTCGVKADDTLACWGNNDYGEATPPAGSFKSVSAGAVHTCGVKADDTLACWGQSGYGQATPPAGSFKSVSASAFHTCGVKADDTLACWGESGYGQATPPAGSFKSVNAGTYHTCGVKADDTLACWGRNDYGQATPPAGSFKSVSAGAWHTCGVKADDTLACWGNNDLGQATPPSEDPPDPPTITATAPASPANDNAPEVQGTLGAGSPTELRIYTSADCTGPVAATGTAAEFTGGGITVTVADNTTTPLSAIAVGGSDSACSNTVSYIEDSAAPNTLIDSGPIGLTNNPSPSFAFHSAEPGASFECRLDAATGGTWEPCDSPKNYTSLAQGPHRFEVRAIDAAANTDPSPAKRTFNVDTTPPNTLIDSGPIGLINNPSPSFGFHSPQPNTSFECRLDPSTGGNWAPCDSPKGYANLAEGPHRFEVRAIDAAGNADPSPAVRTINVDTTPPNTLIDSGPTGPTNNPSPSFAFHSPQPNVTFECRLDPSAGGTWAPCTSPKDYTNLPQGPHTFEVRAIDAAGNADPSPAVRTFNVVP
jgi:hypothetical protein